MTTRVLESCSDSSRKSSAISVPWRRVGGRAGHHRRATTVGLLQRVHRERGGHGTGCDQSRVQQQHMIEALANGREIMMDRHDRAASLPERRKDTHDGTLGHGIHACERLIRRSFGGTPA